MNIVGISTCKGRLEHVKQTSKVFLDNSSENVQYLLVDYGCPEKTGSWVKQTYKSRADALIMNPNTPCFNKTIALNAGARYAIGTMHADYILFFDADTFIYKGFIEKISGMLDPKRFIFVQGEVLDLTGLIIIHKDLFRESSGYEESFRNWGAEDLEFRLRLYAKHKIPFDVIDDEFLGSITHGNDLRTKFHAEQDVLISNKNNLDRMRKLFALYRLQDLRRWKTFEDQEKIHMLLAANKTYL